MDHVECQAPQRRRLLEHIPTRHRYDNMPQDVEYQVDPPPVTYTTKLKLQQLRAKGLTGHAADYEEDHFIPLKVGGHPTDPRNLWPEPWNLPVGSNDYGAHTKDLVESHIPDECCAATQPNRG